MPVTGQDLATALHAAKKHTKHDRPSIALLAFTSVRHHVEVLAELLDIDLRVYPITNDLNLIRSQIVRAKGDGAHIVVAGNITGKLAREYGLPTLMLDSGEVALSGALLEAQKVAYARRLEKVRFKRLQAAVDVSRNGVLVMDAQGYVHAVNTEARRILQLEGSLEGRKATEILPATLLRWCGRREPIVDELLEINGTALLLNANVVAEGSLISDVIFTLQPVAAINELGTKLRRSLQARGLTCQYSFRDILGISGVIQNTIATARSFASTDSPILLAGETGTGKELFAQAIHRASPFASGPFVAVNCAALPPSLLESELFGHEEGAFTGARRNGKPGLFEMAHNGTIFLDEISEMNHYGQTRLLRILQERNTMRIGGDKYIPVTARVVAASNRDLPDMVARGRFRRDLYYRLNVLPLGIPPLRERDGDIPFLANRFLEKFGEKYGSAVQLTPGMLRMFESHLWPGNIRELSNIIERFALLARTGQISELHLADALNARPVFAVPPIAALQPDESEKRQIITALGRQNGHIGRTAADLGIHRTTLQRKIHSLNIQLRKTAN
jgi:transcriptional regulator with PAS, ATPase and Fis domain